MIINHIVAACIVCVFSEQQQQQQSFLLCEASALFQQVDGDTVLRQTILKPDMHTVPF